ncbi:MAG: Ldh family oxidoreductase [Chloroflexota bacterium]|nr:Ldh family oxidoreductase [Chloroflexota bacterium]
MIHITAERLQNVVEKVFVGASVPGCSAHRVAESLVESNLVGHASHGVLRVGSYVEMIEDGRINPQGEITVVRESTTTLLLDGGWNFGQIVAHEGMQRAMDKAREHDMGMVAIHHTGHTGRLGEYVARAAEEGFMAMICGSGSGKGGVVAPYGGTSRLLNTNPITWGIPAAEHPPVFLDFATSVSAWGKIQEAIDKQDSVPQRWLLDAEGKPTTDPKALKEGGAMLPFGDHKGYGLSFLVEVVANGLVGNSCAALPDYERDYALIMTAINIEAFQPLDAFCKMVDDLIVTTKRARKAEGVEEILVPGEYEWKNRERHLNEGLDLPDATWQRIVDTGEKYGVTVTVEE